MTVVVCHQLSNQWLCNRFWKLRCRKSARRSGAKHMSKSKCTKHTRFGALLWIKMSKKCTRLWCESRVHVKSVKTWGRLSDVQMLFCVAGARESIHRQKQAKRESLCSISRHDGRRVAVEEDLERWISRGRRSTSDMFIGDANYNRNYNYKHN